MPYNHKPILRYYYTDFIGAEEDILIKRDDVISILSDVENKYNKVQQEFDIFNPNISFFIGEYVFDKDEYSLYINDEIFVVGNGTGFRFGMSETSTTNYTDDSVAQIENIDKSIGYTDIFFLRKSIFSHDVSWVYDLSSEDMQFDESYQFSQNDILPYTYASQIFYKKVDENFNKISVLSSDTQNINAIIAKKNAISELNHRSDMEVKCNPDTIYGNTFYADSSNISFSNSIELYSGILIFANGFIFGDNTPISSTKAVDTFIESNLSNTDKFIIKEIDIDSREDLELISEDNFNTVSDSLLPIDTASIPDLMYVERSGDNNALTFRELHNILEERLSKFYAAQMKLFLNGYDGSGALGELIKFIIDKIEELKKKYITNDECEKIPINNIDEGCEIDCGNLFLNEPRLIVTKQKMKSIIRCSLSCKGTV